MIAATPVESWCNVTVGIVEQAGGSNKIAFGLTTPAAAGRVSGTLTILTGSARYDVPFHDVAVPHVLSDGDDHSATPIVVQFPTPVPLDAAVISSLDTPNAQPCTPYYSPYSRRFSIGWSHIESREAFIRRASATPAVRAPVPQPYAPAICENRITAPVAVDAFEPQTPDIAAAKKWKGDSTVLVTVDVDGRPVDAQTQTSSGHPELDALAEQAALRSRFTAATFDCAPIVGTGLYVVTWSPT